VFNDLILLQSPVKGLNNPYDPHNFDEFYAGEYGGFGDPSAKPGGMRGAPNPRGGMAGPPSMGRGGGRFGPNMVGPPMDHGGAMRGMQ
jgi:heterogeneous nuclear ribonucleoprotein K